MKPFAIRLRSFFRQMQELIFPLLVPGMALGLPLLDRMEWKWWYRRFRAWPQETLHSATQYLGILLLSREQAWVSLLEDERPHGLIIPITSNDSQRAVNHLSKATKDQPTPADRTAYRRQVSRFKWSQPTLPIQKYPPATLHTQGTTQVLVVLRQ